MEIQIQAGCVTMHTKIYDRLDCTVDELLDEFNDETEDIQAELMLALLKIMASHIKEGQE